MSDGPVTEDGKAADQVDSVPDVDAPNAAYQTVEDIWMPVSVTLEWRHENGFGAVPNLRRCPECFAVVPYEFTAAHTGWHRGSRNG